MTQDPFSYDPTSALRLTPPPLRAALVRRPHLLSVLEHALSGPLTLIAAPPGFGKTTLLSSWVAAQPANSHTLAWVSLEAGDDDPLRFWVVVLMALDKVLEGQIKPLLAQMRTPQPPPIMHLLPALLQILGAQPKPVILVLDDYHAIETLSIHQAVSFAVEHLPPRVHLVLATRTDPPLPLARLRARNQLTEVRADDLRFQEAESAHFLTEVMGLHLSAEDVAALEQRTEGWPAGLQLAAISLRSQRDPHAFVAAFSGSHRYVVDYLADEVLARLPEMTQSFLLRTSIVSRLCSPLCDAIADQRDSQSTLIQLEQAQLFLVPLDTDRRWYRYHTLFGDLLRYRLQQTAPDTLPLLHTRAATWFADHGMTEEAIHHALAAGAYDLAGTWISTALDAMLRGGDVGRLIRWLSSLPEVTLRADPRLSLGYAWCLFYTGQLGAVEAHLDAAEQALRQETLPAHAAQIAALRAHLARVSGDLPRSLALSARALELSPEADLSLRGLIRLNQAGTSRLAGDLDVGMHAYADAAQLYQRGGNGYLSTVARCLQADVQVQQGRLRQAAATYTRVLEEASASGALGSASGLAAAGLAQVHYAWDDLAAVEHDLVVAMEQGRVVGDIDTLLTGLRTQALAYAARGERSGAEQALAQLDAIVQRSGNSLLQALLSTLRVRVDLSLPGADLAAALSWARIVQPTQLPPLSAPAISLTLTVLRVYVVAGSARVDRQMLVEALNRLRELRQIAAQAHHDATVIEALLLEALAHAALHTTPAALDALTRALDLAEPEGHIRLFVDLGAGLTPLLQQVIPSSERHHSYIDRLLKAFGVAPAVTPTSTILHPSVLIEPLSPREREVLELLAQGLSNEAIARVLVVSIATVKKHATGIFSKLGVSSRTQAVARARELGLLA